MRSQKVIKNPPELCIECGACTKHCEFLTKYDINLLDFQSEKISHLAAFCATSATRSAPKTSAATRSR